MWGLVTGLLWLVGLVMLPGYANGFSLPKEVAWLGGGLLLVGWSWVHPAVKPTGKNPWVGAGFIWVSVLFVRFYLWPRLWIPDTLDTTIRYTVVTSGLLPTLTCWVSLLVMDVLVRQADSRQRWAVLGQQVVAVAGVIAVYGLAQRIGLDPFQLGTRSGTHHITPTSLITVYGNPMLTANYLAIVAPLCLTFKPRWCRVVYGLSVLDVVMIQSALSLGALLIGSGVLLVFRRHWRLLGGLGIGSVLGIGWMVVHHTWASFAALSHRPEMWATALRFWVHDPLSAWLGFGLGAVEAATTNHLWSYGSLHCEPLQLLFETGIVGFLILLGWLRYLSVRVWRMPKDTLSMGWVAAAVSYAIVACASFPLRQANVLMLGVLIVAALETFGKESYASIPA